MDLYTEYITPAELTGYAREALGDRPVNALQLAARLPDQTVNDLVYRFNRGGGGLIEAASFRAYGAEPKFGRRSGIARVTGELPPIGQQFLLGEYDSLRLRNAGEELRALFLRDAVLVARSMDVRMEFARGQALVEGRVTLAEDGVQATVDFGRNSAMSLVAPGIVWSDVTNALVLDDMQAWRDSYVSVNGQPPGVIQTSTKVVGYMLRNAQIRSQLLPVGSTAGQVRFSDLQALLSDFDLPPVVKYDAMAVDTTRTARRIIAEDKLLMLPTDGTQMGATLWGTTLEALEPEYGIAPGEHPGMVVAAFKQKTTPISVNTIGAAIGIPILGEPDLAFSADVY